MDQPTDPPMEPHAESIKWFESGPAPILFDPEMATVIVQIGMATNAINSVLSLSRSVSRRRASAAKIRDSLALLVTASAFLKESTELAGREMGQLRPLAIKGGIDPKIINRINELRNGNHPAFETIRLARKELGFHWDDESVGPSVMEFGKNKKLIWAEIDHEGHPVHTLAFNVLIHALFPSADVRDEDDSKAAVSKAIADVGDALDLITEFFTASFYGYAGLKGLTRRIRPECIERKGQGKVDTQD